METSSKCIRLLKKQPVHTWIVVRKVSTLNPTDEDIKRAKPFDSIPGPPNVHIPYLGKLSLFFDRRMLKQTHKVQLRSYILALFSVQIK